jgi:hypothetical protein
MAKMMAAVAVGLLLSPADAAIVWDTTYGKSPQRRLALGMVNSHNDTNDAGCIVGGYDPDHPTRVYVGGPCAQIVNGTPQTGFRYVVMETVDAALAGTDGSEADMLPHVGAGFQHSADHGTYAEAGAGITVHFTHAPITEAALFLSTTSYLAKAAIPGVTKNSFVVGVDSTSGQKTFINDVCIAPCTGTLPASCTTCPTTPLVINQGMYKYSILAAAYNHGNTGKGWEQVKATYGTGTPKTLAGNLNVYQAIDFTNMNADTLTVTATDGTSVKYRDMDACELTTFKSVANSANNCTIYSVNAVTAAADSWTGTYSFPQTYNVGSWSQPVTPANAPISNSISGTRAVTIRCVRPSPANLASAGMATTSKAVYLQYQFDVTGIEATTGAAGGTSTGKYMVYDPTVTSGSAPAPAVATTSAGRIACEPALTFFIMMALATLSIFR